MRYAIIFLVSFFGILPFTVRADEQHIVINEIAAYETSDYEWIELINTGSDAVDLTGWKFFESNTSHRLTAYRGGMTIAPGQYAIIANKADMVAAKYPSFTGTIIDSSWSSLPEKGELIALKDSNGAIVESFTYLATSKGSLERSDPTVQDYTSVNWKENLNGNTIGAKNSVSAITQAAPPGLQTQQEEASQSQTQGSMPTSGTWHAGRGTVLINELLPDSEEDESEWVELYNSASQTISLSGWTLSNGLGVIQSLVGTLGIHDQERFFVVNLSPGSLKNRGDDIVLRDGQNRIIDEVTYGQWDDGDLSNNASAAMYPNSIARMVDGINSFNNKEDFRVTSTPTPGVGNMIVQDALKNKTIQSTLRISELLPNPASQKSDDEFIELYNNGDAPVSLGGWSLSVSSGKTYTIPQASALRINPREYAALYRRQTHLAMRNTGGDQVKLFAPLDDTFVSSVAYHDSARLGLSYAQDDGGRYAWTSAPTPDAHNSIVTPNQPPDVVLDGSFDGPVNAPLSFDASDTSDPDDDPLVFDWSFGDGDTAHGADTQHMYHSPGVYALLLEVHDGAHTAALTRTVTVYSADSFHEDQSVHLASIQKNTKDASYSLAFTDTQKFQKKQPSHKVQKKQNSGSATRVLSPEEARTVKRGVVIVEGVVSASPGVFGDDKFYIAGSGIQIWNVNKQFPKLVRGDRVVVAGTVKSNGGEKAVAVFYSGDVRVVGHDADPSPHDVRGGTITENSEGFLVRSSGVIKKIQWPNIYLEDNGSPFRVYVEKSTKITRPALSVGDSMIVVGIVSKTTTGMRILPRDAHDMDKPQQKKVSAASSSTSQTKDVEIQVPQTPITRRSVIHYLFIASLAVFIVAGGLFLEYILRKKKE